MGCCCSISAIARAEAHCWRMRSPRVAMPLLSRKQAWGSRQPPYITIFCWTCMPSQSRCGGGMDTSHVCKEAQPLVEHTACTGG